MAANSKIEWTEATWNPVAGCSIVSPGCHNCYAMRTAARLEAMGQAKYAGTTKKVNGKTLWTGKINLDSDALSIPLRTKKPTVYFVNSMSDLFHEDVPDEFIDKVFAVCALSRKHTFQVLTKRAERMASYMTSRSKKAAYWKDAALTLGWSLEWEGISLVPFPLPNVWLGVSAEDQRRADERIPWLLKTPAAVRFVSAEPLLGVIDFAGIFGEAGELMPATDAAGHSVRNWMAQQMAINPSMNEYLDTPGVWGNSETEYVAWKKNNPGVSVPRLDWIIAGGESGHGARPCNVDWIRSIVAQCKAAGVSVFTKQLGAFPVTGEPCQPPGREPFYTVNNRLKLKDKKGGDVSEWPAEFRVREMPHEVKP